MESTGGTGTRTQGAEDGLPHLGLSSNPAIPGFEVVSRYSKPTMLLLCVFGFGFGFFLGFSSLFCFFFATCQTCDFLMAVQMEPARRCEMTAPLQETDKLPPAPAQDAHRLRTKAARGGAASCPRSARVLPPCRGCSMGVQAVGGHGDTHRADPHFGDGQQQL